MPFVKLTEKLNKLFQFTVSSYSAHSTSGHPPVSVSAICKQVCLVFLTAHKWLFVRLILQLLCYLSSTQPHVEIQLFFCMFSLLKSLLVWTGPIEKESRTMYYKSVIISCLLGIFSLKITDLCQSTHTQT